MMFLDDTSCSCGIYYAEMITYRAIDDPPPFMLYAPRCVRCNGLITPDQREERAEHIRRALEIKTKHCRN